MDPVLQYVGSRQYRTPFPTDEGVERFIAGSPMDEYSRTVWPYHGHDPLITGTFGFLDFQELHEPPYGDFLFLRLLGVEQTFTRRGYAHALLGGLEEIAHERHVPQIVTSGVRIDNGAMLSLMKREGYKQHLHDEEIHWKLHRYRWPRHIIDVIFEKQL
ncbi:MAG: GNAT family N-acetyltransferase [Nanoarchaeota archaeon]